MVVLLHTIDWNITICYVGHGGTKNSGSVFLLSVQFCNIIPYCDKIIMIIYRVVKSLSYVTIQGLQWVCYFHLLAILLTGYDQQWVVVANEDFP